MKHTRHCFYFFIATLLSTMLHAASVNAKNNAEKEKLTNYVLLNGNVITMDKKDTHAQAIAVKDGRILEVGKNYEMEKFIQQGWQKIDLKGKTVLPGFIDSHSHLDLTGAFREMINGSDLKSIEEINSVIKKEAANTPAGHLIMIRDIHDDKLKENRPPTRYDIDLASTSHPVVLIQYTGHQVYVNSAVVDLFRINPSSKGADTVDGVVNGILRDPVSLEIIYKAIALKPAERKKIRILEVAEEALKKGVTTIQTMQGSIFDPDAAKFMYDLAPEIPVHLVIWSSSNDINKALELKLPRIGGCMDFMADGEIGSHTAAIFEPYSDLLSSKGTLLHPQEYWDEHVLEAYQHDLQFCAHAEAEAGIEAVLWAIEKACSVYPGKNLRPRIEHLELPTMTQLERMSKLGIIASMQPAFVDSTPAEMDSLMKNYGHTRMQRLDPFKSVIEHGIMIAGGSDSPVTPYDPIAGIYFAVNNPMMEDQRVSVKEAIMMFTVNAAYSAFEENEKGTIEAGKLADLVVLSDDPFKIPPQELNKIKVEKVFVEGLVTEVILTEK